MAKREPKLQRRGNNWYARVAVPVALREAGLIKKHKIVLSLKTSDHAEAKRLLHLELAHIDAKFAAARRKLNAKPVQTLPRSEMQYMAVQLFHSREAKRLAAPGGGLDKLSNDEAKADVGEWLTASDWQKLRTELDARQVRVVAMDLPTSWMLAASTDDFTGRMFSAINGMMLDVLAAVARKDYEDRRRRQAQGQAKAKAEGRYRGRAEDTKRNDSIAAMLKAGMSYSQIQNATEASRATIAKIAKLAA